MDDFRKSFEYTDDNRGAVLLFIIMLLTVDIFQAPMFIIPAYGQIKHIQGLNIAFMIISSLFMLFILFTVITCYKQYKYLITVSKTYLVARVFIMTFSIIVLYLYDLKSKSLVGKHYSNFTELTFKGLIAPLALNLLFSIGWYIYFVKSKWSRDFIKQSVHS